LLARLISRLRMTDRVLSEDALKYLYHQNAPALPGDLARALGLPETRLERVLGRLAVGGLITVREGGGALALSENGRAYALHIVRAHRLWERYLADRTGVPMGRWHTEADRKEHFLSPEETRQLYERMGQPVLDPHGDPIPRESGEVIEVKGIELAALLPGTAAEIVHIEDEPDEAYERLLAAGLAPGDRLTALSSGGGAVHVRVAGNDVALSAADAAGVTVRPVVDARAGTGTATLADIAPGEAATVLGLAAACHGPQRRRLLDLGIVPGTRITAEMSSSLGDPIAFVVRGALIALRRDQARWVLIEKPGKRAA
jgi:DtxR family Mn-dependent transcriptional regulator